MKKLFLLIGLFSTTFFGCDKMTAYKPVVKPAEWKVETLADGVKHYTFNGFHVPTNYNQIINVLEVDIKNPKYKLSFNYISRDSLSSFVKKVPNAFAAINGTYGEVIEGSPVSFIKTAGVVKTRVTLAEDNLRFYKHEGAFYYDGTSNIAGVKYGTDALYYSWTYPNIISGAPVLIDDYKPVGETFADPNAPIGTLPGEQKDVIHGIRHPRTLVAVLGDGKVLLITVDGRRKEAGGMSAKELTQMLKTKFNPQYALNIDGGGSTTMWIKNSNLSSTGVVNYPTDAGGFSHYGQRNLNNCIVLTKND